jgi:hypothetical protein
VGSIPASRTKIEQGFTSSDVGPFSLVPTKLVHHEP